MFPLLGARSPQSIFIVVVLPAPFGSEQAINFARANIDGDVLHSHDRGSELAFTSFFCTDGDLPAAARDALCLAGYGSLLMSRPSARSSATKVFSSVGSST